MGMRLLKPQELQIRKLDAEPNETAGAHSLGRAYSGSSKNSVTWTQKGLLQDVHNKDFKCTMRPLDCLKIMDTEYYKKIILNGFRAFPLVVDHDHVQA